MTQFYLVSYPHPSRIIILIITAAQANPWELHVAVDDDTTYTAGGFSLVSQQKACYSSYGGDTTQEN